MALFEEGEVATLAASGEKLLLLSILNHDPCRSHFIQNVEQKGFLASPSRGCVIILFSLATR